MTCTTMLSQNTALPAPDTDGGLPVNRALALRKSIREYDSNRTLDRQTVSNLLWAACGINRPADAHRTNPTAMNWQEIDVYFFDTEAVYRYDFAANALVQVASGDKRAMLAGTRQFSQDFVLTAPAAVLIVIDTAKLPENNDGRTMAMAYVDAGIVSQNINVFCAGNGLATVTRATMDTESLRAALNLPATTIPVLNNPVGYPKD